MKRWKYTSIVEICTGDNIYYAVRYRFLWFNPVYLDISSWPNYEFWWSKGTRYFMSCLTTDIDKVKAAFYSKKGIFIEKRLK